MVVECISGSYKTILTDLLVRKVATEVISTVLQGIPICEPLPSTLSPAGQVQVAAARKGAEQWNIKVDYTDERGETKPYNSPSEVVRALGLKMSGQQTTCDGEKCVALSVVDILRLNGYLVACEDEKGLTLDCLKAKAGGKAMHIMHPAVAMKKKTTGKLSEELRKALEVGRTWTAPPKK